jgi:hypothetical protein
MDEFAVQRAKIRRDDDLLCGRLVALPSTTTRDSAARAQLSQGYQNEISIDFPSMPDTLELARTTDYAVDSNLVMPDGIHQYRSTKPLEIPVSFKLHFMDSQYCKQGAYTLIQLAARLHSFVLPISTYRRGLTLAATAASPELSTGGGQPPQNQLEHNAKSTTIATLHTTGGSPNGRISPPVTCWLQLMWIAQRKPGISCVGYVKDVKVIFGGPWHRGPDNSFNLPTWAEYSFTFMHRPGHGNNVNMADSLFASWRPGDQPHAFADDAKDMFYNTYSLAETASYQGFASDSKNEPVPEPDSAPANSTGNVVAPTIFIDPS